MAVSDQFTWSDAGEGDGMADVLGWSPPSAIGLGGFGFGGQAGAE